MSDPSTVSFRTDVQREEMVLYQTFCSSQVMLIFLSSVCTYTSLALIDLTGWDGQQRT